MKLQSLIYLYIIIAATTACNSYKILSSGKLTNGNKYYFNEVDYFGKDCSDFFGHIKEKNETIVYNSCSSLPPIKVVFNYEGQKKITSKEYFISIVEGESYFPINESEKLLLEIMAKRKFKNNYEHYTMIKGFRKATENDNVLSIRSISQIDKRR